MVDYHGIQAFQVKQEYKIDLSVLIVVDNIKWSGLKLVTKEFVDKRTPKD